MKPFFKAYTGSEKLAQPVREIGRGHNLVILQRYPDSPGRQIRLIGKDVEVPAA
jgi:hypothetical protein